MNIVGSAADAEECVNDTLLASWNAIPPARPEPLLPWLYATVRHIAVDRFRYNRAVRRGGGETTLVLEELEEVIASADSTAEAAGRQELVRALRRFLARQSPRDRDLLMGRYFGGFSCRELADRLGMTEGNCKVRLSRSAEDAGPGWRADRSVLDSPGGRSSGGSHRPVEKLCREAEAAIVCDPPRTPSFGYISKRQCHFFAV